MDLTAGHVKVVSVSSVACILLVENVGTRGKVRLPSWTSVHVLLEYGSQQSCIAISDI